MQCQTWALSPFTAINLLFFRVCSRQFRFVLNSNHVSLMSLVSRHNGWPKHTVLTSARPDSTGWFSEKWLLARIQGCTVMSERVFMERFQQHVPFGVTLVFTCTPQCYPGVMLPRRQRPRLAVIYSIWRLWTGECASICQPSAGSTTPAAHTHKIGHTRVKLLPSATSRSTFFPSSLHLRQDFQLNCTPHWNLTYSY